METVSGAGNRRLPATAPQMDNPLLQAHRVLMRPVERYNRSCRWRRPTARRGAGHSVTDDQIDVLRFADEFAEAMVVTALGTGV